MGPKEDKSQTNEPNIGRGKIEKNHGMGLPFQRPDAVLGVDRVLEMKRKRQNIFRAMKLINMTKAMKTASSFRI